MSFPLMLRKPKPNKPAYAEELVLASHDWCGSCSAAGTRRTSNCARLARALRIRHAAAIKAALPALTQHAHGACAHSFVFSSPSCRSSLLSWLTGAG